MPYEVTIDNEAQAILVRGHGRGTTADTLQLIAEQQVTTFRDNPGYDLIYDSTELEIESSVEDIMKVAEALLNQGRTPFRRLAIVVPTGRIQLARIFAALAHPHGISVNVFHDLHDARNWLRR